MGDILKRIVVGIRDIFWGTAAPDISEALAPGSPAIRNDIAAAAQGFYELITAPIQAKMDELEATHSPMTPEDSVAWTTAFAGVGAAGLGLGIAGSTISEFATLGQVESISDWLNSIWTQAGFAAMLGTPIATMYDSALRIPFRYWTLNKWKPMIPEISDQIRFSVREAYPDVAVADMDTEMKKWIGYLGYSEFWADSYWNAHWIIPTLEQARTLYWRGQVTLDEYIAMLRLSDYDPKYNEYWLELAKNYPGRIDQRWLYEWGAIDLDQLKWFVRAEGYPEEWVGPIADTYAKNILRDEIGRVRTQLITHYREGFMSRVDLESELNALGFRPEVVEMSLKEADLRVELEEKTEYLKVYTDQYKKDKIDRATFVIKCQELDMPDGVINRKAALVEAKKSV